MKALYIRDWRLQYEVGEKGREAGPTEKKLRNSPLRYVRLHVDGRNHGADYRRLLQVTGTPERLMLTWALWTKCLEIAASNAAERRGYILDEKGRPASAADIAFFTGFPKNAVEEAIGILIDPQLQWLVERDLPEPPGNPPESPEPSGNPPPPSEDEDPDAEEKEEGKSDPIIDTGPAVTENGSETSQSGFPPPFSSASGSAQQPVSDGGDLIDVEKAAQVIILTAHIDINGQNTNQRLSERRCWISAMEAVNKTRQPKEVFALINKAATEIASDHNVAQYDRPKVLVARTKKILKTHGVEWGMGQGRRETL